MGEISGAVEEVITKPEFVIRKMVANDLSLILSTWLRSYRHSSKFAQKITNKDFFTYHHMVAKGILARPSSFTYVACDSADQDVIYGYGVFEKNSHNADVIHFIYVKSSFRDFGVGKALFNESGFNPNNSVFTHWTYPMDTIKPKYPNLRYVPYFL